MPRSSVLAIVIGLLAGSQALADAGDPDLTARGARLAQLVCSVCHVVARDDTHVPRLAPPGPSLVEVAARSSTTETSLRGYLATRHPDMGPAGQMPNPRLVDYEIDELVAYILSLRK